MKTPVSLVMDEPLFRTLFSHLFPGDGDEHGAVLSVGIAEGSSGTRLLARQVFLAEDGVDYVPGKRGYRALAPAFIARVSDICAEQKLGYLAVHPHGGRERVGFSSVDLESHERGYPALVDITNGGPVGGLVFTPQAVAGDIWTPQGRFELNHATVVGSHMLRFYPAPPKRPTHVDPVYDRHARLFGDVGQAILQNTKVGIIGLGGAGSLISEWLSRLGVGHIVAVDYDRVEITNLPRIVGARRGDTRAKRYKVHIAERVAKEANPSIRYDAVVGNVVDEATARLLTDVDFLFLASDSMQSRLVFNAVVYQYLVPGVQVGAKVSVDRKTGQITDIFTVSRPVLPYAAGGCLHCHELISAARLQEEALSEGERRAQRYVEHADVAQPSVLTLNVLATAPAVNEFMMMFTGLYDGSVQLLHQTCYVRERETAFTAPRRVPDCLDCSNSARSRRARGDRARLPCRIS